MGAPRASPAASRNARCRPSRGGEATGGAAAPPTPARVEARRTESPRLTSCCSSTASGSLSLRAVGLGGASGSRSSAALWTAARYARSRAEGPDEFAADAAYGAAVSARLGGPPRPGSTPGGTTAAPGIVSGRGGDTRTGSSRNAGRLGRGGASSPAEAAAGLSSGPRLGRTTTTAVSTVIPMSTAATVSAFRLRRFASGGGGRRPGVEATSVDSEGIQWRSGLVLDAHTLDQDLLFSAVHTRHEDGAIEEPIRDVGIAAHDGVVDEHLAAVRLEEEEHRRLGMPRLDGELQVDAAPIVEDLRGRPRAVVIPLHAVPALE